MRWFNNILFFLFFGFAFSSTHAQYPERLSVSAIIELAEMDRYEMSKWANNQNLWAQIVKKGEIEVRQWVPEGAPEQAEAAFGLSACAGIRSIIGGFGYFKFTCKEKYLEEYKQDALALGFKQDTIGSLLNQELEDNNGYYHYIYLKPPSQGKQAHSGLHIAVCSGWIELKYIP